MTENIDNHVIFVISHKYIRGYESYLEYYVNNIRNFYEKSLIIIVDNNSKYKEDVLDKFKNAKDVIILDNNIDSKFELGAYTVGLKYIIDNRIENYGYVVFSQDTFLIKNRFDFSTLAQRGTKSCPIVGCLQREGDVNLYNHIHNDCRSVWEPILTSFDMMSDLDKISFCWCTSFVTSIDKVVDLYNIISKIKITVRWESCASERYMARILWELNDKKNDSIDGDLMDIKYKYDCHNVDVRSEVNSYFVKRCQQKTENTVDQ